MSEPNSESGSGRFLLALVAVAMVLAARLMVMVLGDPSRFPINKVATEASFQHISRDELKTLLSRYNDRSFALFPVGKLKADLQALPWTETAVVQRIWPDTLSIRLQEKIPYAFWNRSLITKDGQIIPTEFQWEGEPLPQFNGPAQQQSQVLQTVEKLSKLLAPCGLRVISLTLKDNQDWVLGIENGITLRLGKNDIERRVLRFCKAYPAVFAGKTDSIVSVDLRYPRGMAVRWKEAQS